MAKMKSNRNIFNALYTELKEEDRKYGDKRLEKPESEMRRDRRPLKNLRKAWMEHVDDYDEIDDFYEH